MINQNQNQNINPAVVAFVSAVQQSQMHPNYQQQGAMGSAHQVVTDVTCGETGALFTLLNGSSFTLGYVDMVMGLQVAATGNLVTLSYMMQPMQPGAVPVDNLRLTVENRVVALACSPMTAKLIEPLRRVVTGGAQPQSSTVSQVTFATPLMMRGISSENFNQSIIIYGYALSANRSVELDVSIGSREVEKIAHPATTWRKEMEDWTEATVLAHEHRVLLSIIKLQTTTPQDSTNDIQPRNTVNKYHGRSTSADAAEPEETKASFIYLTGNGINRWWTKHPVHTYEVISRPDDVPLVQFFDKENTMMANVPVTHLALSKSRQGVHGLAVEFVTSSVSAGRRKTLIEHAIKHGAEALANALIKLKK